MDPLLAGSRERRAVELEFSLETGLGAVAQAAPVADGGEEELKGPGRGISVTEPGMAGGAACGPWEWSLGFDLRDGASRRSCPLAIRREAWSTMSSCDAEPRGLSQKSHDESQVDLAEVL